MSKAKRVLVVEDDPSMRAVIRYNLVEDGFEVVQLTRGDQALEHISKEGDPKAYDLVISDVKMPGASGMEVLAAVRSRMPLTPVVLVTAFGTVEHAIEALLEGAADYITKPFRRSEFKTRVARALEQAALRHENEQLRATIAQSSDIVTASEQMREILRVVERLARSDVTVLILGESGTGKELVAKRLHAQSARAGGPFVPVNCAALPGELLESELFGHDRGAFTGAVSAHQGTFERANKGTLLLDEIGELPLALQAKILRVLEEGVVDRVGGRRRIPVDIRILAATNTDLQAEVVAGRFREDLFHRLSVVPLVLPPLRERPEDIPLLVRHFLREALTPAERSRVTVAETLMAELVRRPWPGNVRELKNLVLRMVLLRNSDTLDLADLAEPGRVLFGGAGGERTPTDVSPQSISEDAPSEGALLVPGELELPKDGFSLPALEKEIVLKALARHDGNQSKTAQYLGIPRHVLIYRIAKYNLRSPRGQVVD